MTGDEVSALSLLVKSNEKQTDQILHLSREVSKLSAQVEELARKVDDDHKSVHRNTKDVAWTRGRRDGLEDSEADRRAWYAILIAAISFVATVARGAWEYMRGGV